MSRRRGRQRTAPYEPSESIPSCGLLSPGPFGLRPDVHAFTESEIDVIDVGHAVSQCACEIEVRAQALRKLVVPHVNERCVVLENDGRILTVSHVNLRDTLR